MVYPGNIWQKRIGHTVVLSTICLTIFLNRIENRIYNVTIETIGNTGSLLPDEDYGSKTLYVLASAFHKIEESRFRWIVDRFSLPTSEDLRKKAAAVEKLERLIEIAPRMSNIQRLVSLVSYLMWVPIVFSFYWMIMDLKYGHAKLFTGLCLMFAIVVNICINQQINHFITI